MELPSFLGFAGADPFDFPMPTLFLIPRPVIEDMFLWCKASPDQSIFRRKDFQGWRCRIRLYPSFISHQETRLLPAMDWGLQKICISPHVKSTPKIMGRNNRVKILQQVVSSM